jgi:hypothetical protein
VEKDFILRSYKCDFERRGIPFFISSSKIFLGSDEIHTLDIPYDYGSGNKNITQKNV